MQGGESERAQIMASAVQNEEGATISCVVQPVEVPADGSSGGSQDGEKKKQSGA